MNKLLQERLVELESEEDIDNLKPYSVTSVKNGVYRVFSGKDGDNFTFYFHYDFEGEVITELTTPRKFIELSGSRLYFYISIHNKRVELTSEDGERFETRKKDLVALGLMKE